MKKSKRMGYIEDKKLESHGEYRECVCVWERDREWWIVLKEVMFVREGHAVHVNLRPM